MRKKPSTPGSQTDWDKLRGLRDEEIDYSDIPPLDEAFFQEATHNRIVNNNATEGSLVLNPAAGTTNIYGGLLGWTNATHNNFRLVKVGQGLTKGIEEF